MTGRKEFEPVNERSTVARIAVDNLVSKYNLQVGQGQCCVLLGYCTAISTFSRNVLTCLYNLFYLSYHRVRGSTRIRIVFRAATLYCS